MSMESATIKPAKSAAAAGRRSFLHDALVLIVNQFLAVGLSFLIGIVLARSLGREGRGLIAAATIYPQIFLSLTELGLRQSAVFHLGKGLLTNDQVSGAVSTMTLLSGAVGVVICTSILALSDNPGYTPLIIALAVAPIPMTIYKHFSSGIFLGNRLVGQFAKIERMVQVQTLLLILLMVCLLGWGVVGAMTATVLASAVVCTYALWRISRFASLKPRLEWPVLSVLVKKGVLYAIAVFVISLNYRLNTAVLERMSNVGEIGIYTIAVGIAQLTWALPQSITTALFSHSATAKDEQAFSVKVARLFRVTIVIALLLVIVIAICAPFVLPLVYGTEFEPSVMALHLLLPGVFALLPLKILNMDLAGRGRPNASLWVMTPALLINAALSFYLVPTRGANGAALASSISYAVGGIGMMFLYCRVTGMRLVNLCRYQRSDFDFIGQLRQKLLRRVK